MDMSLREIASLALDELELENEKATNPQGAAATLQFNLQQHLDQYHGGQQPKGECKYMDKFAQQAKALGVADKIPGLNGGEGGGKSVDDTEVKNSAEWKQYITDRQVQDATFTEKLKAMGVENPQLNGSGYNEDQMKVVEEWHKAIDERRDKYLKEALGDAEAHCVEQLADIIDAGGEKADKALKLAEDIAAKYGEGDPRHIGAEKMKDRAERRKQKEEFDKRQAEQDARQKEQDEREKQLKEREAALGKEKPVDAKSVRVEEEGNPSDDGRGKDSASTNGNLGEVQVGNKTYVDLSGKGFFEGMAAAFKAGFNGKDIVTDWDKMTGRWDQLKASDPKFAESLKNLQMGTAGQKIKSDTAKMLEEMKNNADLSATERMAASAALAAIQSGKDEQKAMKEFTDTMGKIAKSRQSGEESERKQAQTEARTKAIYDQNQRNADKAAADEKRKAEKEKRDNLKLGIAPEGVVLTEEEEAYRKRQEDSLKAKFTAQQISQAKAGVLPEGVDPESEIGQIAAMQKKKLEAATEKAEIALGDTKAKHLDKPVGVSDPDYIETLKKTAEKMKAVGGDANISRAKEIEGIIDTLNKTTDRKEAHNAIESFKRLIGVNDNARGGGKRSESGTVSNFTAKNVDHDAGGVVRGHSRNWTTATDAAVKLEDIQRVKGTPDKLNEKKSALNRIATSYGAAPGSVNVQPHTTYTDLTFKLANKPSEGDLRQIKTDLLREMKHNMNYDNGQYNIAASGVSITYDDVDQEVKVRLNNDTPTTVPFKDFVSSESYKNAIKKNPQGVVVPAGQDENGDPMYLHLSSSGGMPHLTICGKTGSGKGMSTRAIVGAIMSNYSPNRVKLAIADPKKEGGYSADYGAANGSDFMISDVVGADGIPGLLKWARKEHSNRMAIITKAGYRDIDTYNKAMGDKADENGEPLALPDIVMPIDEFSNLIKQNGKSSTSNDVEDLAEIARSSGIHLILITQRPDAKTLTGKIASAAPDVMCHQLENDSDSSVSMLKGMNVKGQTGRGSAVYRGSYIDKDGNKRKTPSTGLSLQAVTIGDTDICTLAKHKG